MPADQAQLDVLDNYLAHLPYTSNVKVYKTNRNRVSKGINAR